ncbi:MAG: NAD(P)/FAD-dependent oxidoreductase [Atopobiaceae bacterium]|nr:NAD(P)/FAD-dependent oxidoreductase [Atopobiaceae bacterium]
MYDVVFLGSGHSCWHGAVTLAAAGKKVAIVDGDLPGGTCTNYGCDAKIILDGPFEFVEGLDRYQGLCVEGNGTIDWRKLMAYKRHVLAPFPQMMPAMFESMGIEFVPEFGKLVDAHTVQAGERTLETEHVVIGTGQRDSVLDIPGKEFLHNSREFLDIDEMPEHLICIGAGIIGMEFASMALVLGKKVSFVEFAPRALAAYPEAYVATLVAKMEAQGADFHFGEAAAKVEEVEGGYRLTTASGLAVEGDYVLCAAGRVANYENLGLEELGIEASRRGIVVDDHLRTSVPNVFASGDVIDKAIPRLTPTAEFESNYIAAQLLGDDAPICYPVVPNLVFTLPRIAQVGVTLDEAKADPEAYRIDEWHYGVANEWVDNRELDIDMSFVLDNDGHLVGAAIIGSEAGTWIDFLTLVINTKLTATDISKMIFAFPTQTYMLASHLAQVLAAR